MDYSRVNPIVPLAVLEAVRLLDQRGPEGLEEYRKLGRSSTVTAQIDRYRRLARTGGHINMFEMAQLFRLVCRRPDAELVLSNAGRGAARQVLLRVPRSVRLARGIAPRGLRSRIGIATASRMAVRFLGVSLSREGQLGVVAVVPEASRMIDPDGIACTFFGVAIAELLRSLTGFTGALMHDACCARGDAACSWHTGNKTYGGGT